MILWVSVGVLFIIAILLLCIAIQHEARRGARFPEEHDSMGICWCFVNHCTASVVYRSTTRSSEGRRFPSVKLTTNKCHC